MFSSAPLPTRSLAAPTIGQALGSARLGKQSPSAVVRAAMIGDVDLVDVVLANNDRVTLRVGDTFLKVDADQQRTDVEVEAINLAPVPTPEILWRKPPVLAAAALRGRTLGRIGEPSTASPTAWTAVGETLRALHDAPLPPWPGTSVDALATRLADECEWLISNSVLPADTATAHQMNSLKSRC